MKKFLACLVAATLLLTTPALAAEKTLPGTAHLVPKHTTSEGSGYFSIIGGLNGKVYVGTAKYGSNAFLVEFDPKTEKMQVVVDTMQEIGSDATGFAAQAKIHTRNNVGQSGRIYFATKQGYPKEGEKLTDYLGGYPMVYDPRTGETRVYPIPIKHHGIISITPDESRGVAYISTCTDSRPLDHTHFMILDLKTGKYRDLGDLEHLYAFIVVDHRGRAYHPVRGGRIARYDPQRDELQRLDQAIDGKPPAPESHLADENGHPINWDVSPDGKTLYSLPMSTNRLYAYDLTGDGRVLQGKSLGALIPGAERTDCRAMCVGPEGTVWAAVTSPGMGHPVHIVRYRPGDKSPRDLGTIVLTNPDFTEFTGSDGKPLKWHMGYREDDQGRRIPRYPLGITQAQNGSVYVQTLYPLAATEVKAGDLK